MTKEKVILCCRDCRTTIDKGTLFKLDTSDLNDCRVSFISWSVKPTIERKPKPTAILRGIPRKDITILAPVSAETCVIVYINDNDCQCHEERKE